MSYESFISKLNPKVASAIKTADEVEIEKLELASFGITRALGGGIGKGRMTLVYGSTSGGKSALLIQSIGKWQKQGLVCGYIDVEGTYDKDWATRLGVNNKELILQGSRSSGRIEKEALPLIENGIDVLVLDSVSDILPEVFLGKDGEMNDQSDRKQLGSQAKAITALVNGFHYENRNTAIVLLSQTTTSIQQSYVEQVPHGGEKIKFSSSQIIRLNSSPSPNAQIMENIHVGDSVLNIPAARKVDFVIRKNKLGRPFGTGEYVFRYAGDKVGIDQGGEVIDAATAYGIVRQSGAWFYYGDNKWQGKPAFSKEVSNDEDLLEELKAAIVAKESNG